jgi:hypothetical protein
MDGSLELLHLTWRLCLTHLIKAFRNQGADGTGSGSGKSDVVGGDDDGGEGAVVVVAGSSGAAGLDTVASGSMTEPGAAGVSAAGEIDAAGGAIGGLVVAVVVVL